MARYVYAKVYCDFLRHPMFFGRPDCDKIIALALILHAKEHSLNGSLDGVGVDEARRLSGTKATPRQVQDCLDYLIARGWLSSVNGTLTIRDFESRQAPDSPAERMSRWRDQNRDDGVTKRNAPVTAGVTPAFPEGDRERDQRPPPTPPAGGASGFRFPRSRRPKKPPEPECNYCRKPGHVLDACPEYQQQKAQEKLHG